MRLQCVKVEQFYFEIVIKDDFLPMYLDPYYDVYQSALSTNEEALRMTLTKKKRELKAFQDHNHDYFSIPMQKDYLIQRYLEVTKDPKLVEEEKWRNIQDEVENAQDDPECIIIGEPSRLSHLNASEKNVTPSKEPPLSALSARKSSMGNTNYGAGNTNKFTELSSGFPLGHNQPINLFDRPESPDLLTTKINTSPVKHTTNPHSGSITGTFMTNNNNYTSLGGGKHVTSSPYEKFNLKSSPNKHALTRFSTHIPDPAGGKYLSLEQHQVKSFKQAKNAAASGKVSNSDRQREWFLTDKRLIFSCNNFNDFNLWVTKLEELIASQNDQVQVDQMRELHLDTHNAVNISHESPNNKSSISIPRLSLK